MPCPNEYFLPYISIPDSLHSLFIPFSAIQSLTTARIGGTVGLIATAMVTKGGLLWGRYYLLTLSFAMLNLFFAGWAFLHYEVESGPTLLTHVQRIASRTENGPTLENSARVQAKEPFSSMVKAFKSKTVILGSLFIFAYYGTEVSISGWVISFLVASRNGTHPQLDT